MNPDQDALREKAVAIHTTSSGSAGARTIAGQLSQSGLNVGRCKTKRLMKKAGIVSTQWRKQDIKSLTTNLKLPLIYYEASSLLKHPIRCGVEMLLTSGQEQDGYI
jgi:hypothetical protein